MMSPNQACDVWMELESPEVWSFQCLSSFPALENVSGARTTKHKCFRWSFIWASGGWDCIVISICLPRKSTQLHAWRTWILVSWLNYPPMNYHITQKRRFWVHDLPAFPFGGICFRVSWRVYNCFWYPLTFDHAPMDPLRLFLFFVSGACHSSITSKGNKGSFILSKGCGSSPLQASRKRTNHSPIAYQYQKCSDGKQICKPEFYLQSLVSKGIICSNTWNKLFNLNTPNIQFCISKITAQTSSFRMDFPWRTKSTMILRVNFMKQPTLSYQKWLAPQIFHWCNKSQLSPPQLRSSSHANISPSKTACHEHLKSGWALLRSPVWHSMGGKDPAWPRRPLVTAILNP